MGWWEGKGREGKFFVSGWILKEKKEVKNNDVTFTA